MNITENRYSGIPTIRKKLKEYGLPEPEFKNERGEFTVCFRQQLETETEQSEKESTLVDFCKTPRTRKELATFLGLSSVTYAISKYVQPLIDKGTIKLSIPDYPSSPKQKYFS